MANPSSSAKATPGPAAVSPSEERFRLLVEGIQITEGRDAVIIVRGSGAGIAPHLLSTRAARWTRPTGTRRIHAIRPGERRAMITRPPKG